MALSRAASPKIDLARLSRTARTMKTTRYFQEQVLRKRPYIRVEWCDRIVKDPLAREAQTDGRIRHWGVVPELAGRILRVVTLEDGETIHNAFPDRNFRVRPQEEQR
jgi:hypothetical protein